MSDVDIGDKKDNSGRALFKLCGVSLESVEKTLSDIKDKENPRIEIEAHAGEIIIRLDARMDGDLSVKKVLKPVVKEVKTRLGEMIYTTDESETLENMVVRLLIENHLTITTAESCTGGLFAGRLVNVPGASDVFKEGFITYSNKAKKKYLGVKKRSLDNYTAVSEQVAKEMAKGACELTGADCGISITGLAGPDGGTPEKPVGLVYIGCTVDKNTVVKEYRFKGDRQEIRCRAVTEALALLRLCLLRYFSEITFGVGKKKK